LHDVVKSEPGPGRNVVHDGNPEPGPAPTARRKKAARYLGDRMWSQALDQYKAAAKMSPNDPRALQGIALSHYMIGDFVEADDAAEKLLASGGSLSFPIAHFHAMGLCTGVLTIQKGKLAYSGTSDAFEIGPNAGVAVEIHKPKGMIANEKLPDWPILDIRGRAAEGKEKKAQMLPYNFCKQQNRSGKNIGSAFPMDDSDVAQMEKFERSMAALIQKFVR
jgi:tetratricopeptide (TPR) repeat protein